ncbi:hypothetical protein ACW14X_00700 [Nocardioides sp. YJ-D4]
MSDRMADGAALPEAVATALAELKERLRDPGTVRIALKQYVVSEIVKTVLEADADASLALEGTAQVLDNKDDAGGASCVEESYSLFGVEVYHHTVCGSSTVSNQITVHL